MSQACRRSQPGAPDVVIVRLDDVGFGASSVFAGPVDMPTAQRLADVGGSTEIATSAAGYKSLRPNTMAPLAKALRYFEMKCDRGIYTRDGRRWPSTKDRGSASARWATRPWTTTRESRRAGR
jgi:hypothetical protein